MRPQLPEFVRESNWLIERQAVWEKMRYVSQEDLEHFCGDYVPAIMRGAPSDIGFVHVRVIHVNQRSGVLKTTELLNWEFDELPPDGQIIVVTEGARREARKIAANDLVVHVECEFTSRGGPRHNRAYNPKLLS